MKQKFLFICFLIVFGSAYCAYAGPEPAPWWKNVEDTQALLLKWITAITVVGGALVTAIGGLALMISGKLKEIRDRQDRASEEKRQLQAQVITLAANQSPPSQPTTTQSLTPPSV